MDHSIKTIKANGLDFAFFEAGAGPLVLLLHGFPDTPHTWAEIQPQIAEAGFRVIAPFMRGYAPTQAPANGDYGVLQLGRDVLALIDALGEASAVVIGHDWGAIAAYVAANLDPGRVHRLVTLAIPHPAAISLNFSTLLRASHFVTFQFRPWAVARLKRNNFAELEAIYRRWSPGWQVTQADLEPVRQAFQAPGGVRNALGYYWSFPGNLFGLQAAATRRIFLARTATPTLSFFGEQDGALNVQDLERTHRHFTGDYEIVRVPRAGHFLHREAPAIFMEKTLDFIGLPSESGSAEWPGGSDRTFWKESMNPTDSSAWLNGAITYFRAFGFFAEHRGSERELADRIRAHWRGDWDELLSGAGSPAAADQLLLVADTARVWWHDLEGAYRGADFYRAAIGEWAAISRGRFAPEQMAETWQADDGPADVTFVLSGSRHSFQHTGGDYLDHGILKVINRALEGTLFRYEVATDFGDSNWITVLTQDEKRRLAAERGWRFLWP